MTGASPLEGLVERGWILPKPSPLACYPCGLPYSGEHWVEAVVADDVWQRISPSGDSGGILCVNCMAARLHHLGLDRVQVKLTAGPFCDSHSQLERVTEALTPSAETKAAYIGEFKFSVRDGYDEQDEEIFRDVLVPWTTIKEIMAAIRDRAAIKEGGL